VVPGGSDGWSPWMLCEALAEKRHWVLPHSGRLDTYRCGAVDVGVVRSRWRRACAQQPSVSSVCLHG
jgi:hypothetical protein